MPFTPFHMGPGILIKAVLQGSFSLMVFGWSQVIMDIQPLVIILTGEGHLHGFSHTFLGATLIALFSAMSGKYLSEYGLGVIGVSKQQNPINISWPVAILSAFVGALSHVFLDALMHADLQPYYPFSTDNGLLDLISVEALHNLCLYTAVVGAVLYFSIYRLRKALAEPQ